MDGRMEKKGGGGEQHIWTSIQREKIQRHPIHPYTQHTHTHRRKTYTHTHKTHTYAKERDCDRKEGMYVFV